MKLRAVIYSGPWGLLSNPDVSLICSHASTWTPVNNGEISSVISRTLSVIGWLRDLPSNLLIGLFLRRKRRANNHHPSTEQGYRCKFWPGGVQLSKWALTTVKMTQYIRGVYRERKINTRSTLHAKCCVAQAKFWGESWIDRASAYASNPSELQPWVLITSRERPSLGSTHA